MNISPDFVVVFTELLTPGGKRKRSPSPAAGKRKSKGGSKSKKSRNEEEDEEDLTAEMSAPPAENRKHISIKMAKTYGKKPITFSFEENGEQFMIGSEVSPQISIA